jgi:hypothetical protein
MYPYCHIPGPVIHLTCKGRRNMMAVQDVIEFLQTLPMLSSPKLRPEIEADIWRE